MKQKINIFNEMNSLIMTHISEPEPNITLFFKAPMFKHVGYLLQNYSYRIKNIKDTHIKSIFFKNTRFCVV